MLFLSRLVACMMGYLVLGWLFLPTCHRFPGLAPASVGSLYGWCGWGGPGSVVGYWELGLGVVL